MSRDPYDAIFDYNAIELRGIIDAFASIVEHVESPIEKILHVAFEVQLYMHNARPKSYSRFDKLVEYDVWGRKITREVQKKIGSYRVDFLFTVTDKAGVEYKLVVECDGHDFHERTKEQAARDRSRDRSLTLDGYGVMRFTGSEIHKNPGQCAYDIFSWLWGKIEGRKE